MNNPDQGARLTLYSREQIVAGLSAGQKAAEVAAAFGVSTDASPCPTLTLSTGRIIPARWVGEQHVKEDLGFIPSFADRVKAIRPEPWMGQTTRIEALVDPYLASPVVKVA